MSDTPKFATPDQASAILSSQSRRLGAEQIAVVHNPSYVYAPIELYPLAPRPTAPLPRLAGVVMDMDGTTTTTEPLCLHSLAWMVAQITGGVEIDPERDYPHIIGNSTTKHVEYLIQTYGDAIQPRECLRAFLEAAVWTLSQGRDPGRRAEVRASLRALGLAELLDDPAFNAVAQAPHYDPEATTQYAAGAIDGLLERFRMQALGDRVRAAVDIYYRRYHELLGEIADGRGAQRAAEVLGSEGARLIEPMPGIGIFLAALKGWLGADLERFHEPLAEHVAARKPGISRTELDALRPRLGQLGRYLQRHPAPIGVVTSSIAYEARIVLGEVFAVLRDEVADWPVGPEVRDRALEQFEDPVLFYDAMITASDSSEIRLKPHRDLYSIALHTMGLGHDDLPCVLGMEDSESGVIAIRAAGVGLSVAVPFAETAGHDLSAAAHILPAQVPEAILVHQAFLAPEALEG